MRLWRLESSESGSEEVSEWDWVEEPEPDLFLRLDFFGGV